ncbi:CLUMA_CG003632, isoform A [Clunio marinus]|uniref:CLUMA_CG003632, isoform A n=1 Tax=Clunio marinus TaxID=568069 RepID=A0A1J1HR83_9DIPT|nr:CLUMA_CG003632, isoform A [Clunio marinus]
MLISQTSVCSLRDCTDIIRFLQDGQLCSSTRLTVGL